MDVFDNSRIILHKKYEQRHEKICLLGFRPGPAVQSQKTVRGLTFWIKKEEALLPKQKC